MNRRLLVAYLVSPWGALIPMVAVWAVALALDAWATTAEDLTLVEMLSVAPWQAWLWPVAAGYGVGALLIPVFVLFEHRGWRGWRYYVPSAILATGFMPLTIALGKSALLAWGLILQPDREGIGAVSSGCAFVLVETLLPVLCAACCAGIFSYLIHVPGPSTS